MWYIIIVSVDRAINFKTELTALILTPNTWFIYEGISVINVQKPQFCPQCAMIKDINGKEVHIDFHGVGSL